MISRVLHSSRYAGNVFSNMDLSDNDLQQRAEADRREVDPPIQVQTATWSKAGQLDWWVKEPAGIVGSRTRSTRPTTVDQSC
jgi:hypothetical protein